MGTIPIPKHKLPGAHPREQGRWGYIEGLDRPHWCKGVHDTNWWQAEYRAGWEHERFLDEQRKSLYASID